MGAIIQKISNVLGSFGCAHRSLLALERKSLVALQAMSNVGLTSMNYADVTSKLDAFTNEENKTNDKNNQPTRDEGSEEEYSEVEQRPVEGAYDANEYSTLPVGSDIKELFQFINDYLPQTVEIEPMLKPFILDYIPAVGDIDAFIKIPRPDEVR